MTQDELREINFRVALALGWKVPLDGEGNPWAEGSWWVIDGVTKAPLHQDFTSDPAAADLVRQEIERRGWLWSVGPWEEKRYCSVVTGGTYRCSKPPYGIASADEWAHALCLAFLTAHDAQKEQEGKP